LIRPEILERIRDERRRRRMVLAGEGGMKFLLDLAEDGTVVGVIAKPEPLVEITAADAAALARLAWHLGNRHAELQVAGDRLRMRRDHVLEDMLVALGAHLVTIEAPGHDTGGGEDG
jgi:urease accessory protein